MMESGAASARCCSQAAASSHPSSSVATSEQVKSDDTPRCELTESGLSPLRARLSADDGGGGGEPLAASAPSALLHASPHLSHRDR